jgi:hypothetical protein
MAFLSVLEQFLGRTGSGDSKALREYTRVFKVVVDSLLYDSRTILGAPGLPLLWDLYIGSDGIPDELGARLHKYTAEHAEDFAWVVTAHYTNQPKANTGRGRNGTQEAGDKNPLNRPTEISIDAVTFQQPIDFTPGGVAICSSTGERFDPAVSRDDSRRIYTFTRTVPIPSPIADTYKDVVNSDVWNGNPPGTAKIGTIKYVRADENGQTYWKETTPISVDFDGWDAKVMDVGTKWIDGANKPFPFIGMHGEQLTGTHGLNGEGGPLYPQGDGTPGACGTLVGGARHWRHIH